MKRFTAIASTGAVLVAVVMVLGLGCSDNSPAGPTSAAISDADHFTTAKNGPPDRNLIRNPGFEQGTLFWFFESDFWRLTDVNPHNGTVCMRYSVPAGNNWPIGVMCTNYYQIWLEEGAHYRLSYWSRQDNPDGDDQDCWVWCRVMCEGVPLYTADTTYPDASWKQDGFMFVSPGSRPVYVEVWVSVDALLSPGGVALDDFALYRMR